MLSCVVKWCKNNSCVQKKPCGITFHKFPTATKWKERWIRAIRDSRNEEDWLPSKYSVVCSMHFEECDIYTTPNVGYIVAIVIFSPPVVQHFIFPLSFCLLADFCNHTWIPECGELFIKFDEVKGKAEFLNRLFIDECDMFEYNCDNNLNYSIADNYSDCFRPQTCPTVKGSLRMGDYKFVLEGRKIVYDPPRVTNPMYFARRRKPTTLPDLPAYMLRGKKRWTPTRRIKYKHTRSTATPRTVTQKPMKRSKDKKTKKKVKTFPTMTKSMKWTKKSTNKETPESFILTKEFVIRNGKKMVKVVKVLKKSVTTSLLPVKKTIEHNKTKMNLQNVTDESKFDISVFGNEIIDSDFIE